MDYKVICKHCEQEVKRSYAKQKQDEQGNFHFTCDRCDREIVALLDELDEVLD